METNVNRLNSSAVCLTCDNNVLNTACTTLMAVVGPVILALMSLIPASSQMAAMAL